MNTGNFLRFFCSAVALTTWGTVFGGDRSEGATGENPFQSVVGESERMAGVVGIRSTGTGNPPPMDPSKWRLHQPDVLTIDDVWGRRVEPTDVYKAPEGLGLLYNSVPGGDWVTGARTQTGSLAKTKDLLVWRDYDANPVLYEPQPAWQHHNRVMPGALLYDPRRERFVVYYGDQAAGGNRHYPGIRAIGLAYSEDLLEWSYKSDAPVITIEDFAREAPEMVDATDRQLRSAGRVYAQGALYHEGRYYVFVSGTRITGENRQYERIALVADSPEGPFERARFHPEDRTPRFAPVYYDGKYYTIFSTRVPDDPDNRGIGIASAGDFFGPYIDNPENPIVVIDHDSSAGKPTLFKYNGTWAIVFRVTYEDGVRNMRLASTLPR